VAILQAASKLGVGVAVFAVLLLASNGSLGADLQLILSTGAFSGSGSPEEYYLDESYSGVSLSREIDVSSGANSSSALGLAEVQKVGLSADNLLTEQGSTYAYGYAYSTSHLTLDAPGMSGQTVTVTAQISVDGTLSGAATGSALITCHAEFALTARGSQVFTTYLNLDNSGITSGDLVPGLHTVSFDVIAGQPFDVQFYANVDIFTDGLSGDTAESHALFGNTFKWAGVTEVRDSENNLVINYTLGDLDGNSWITAIPEPSTGVLVMLGFLLPALLLRSKTQPV
jgi:hypothetical protein